MVLKEAIEHLDESLSDNEKWNGCEECKSEHEQLKKWLLELQEMKTHGVYFITVFQRLEENDLGWPDYGDRRTWGYYYSKNDAIQALHENWTDMQEFLYNYAVIEQIQAGICGNTHFKQWFQWDNEKQGFFEIEEPELMKHFCNFAIG